MEKGKKRPKKKAWEREGHCKGRGKKRLLKEKMMGCFVERIMIVKAT